VTRELLDILGLDGKVSRKGVPAPIQVGKRWVVERTRAWMNGYGKLRRCTDENADIVYLCLAASSPFVNSSNESDPATAGTPDQPPDD